MTAPKLQVYDLIPRLRVNDHGLNECACQRTNNRKVCSSQIEPLSKCQTEIDANLDRLFSFGNAKGWIRLQIGPCSFVNDSTQGRFERRD